MSYIIAEENLEEGEEIETIKSQSSSLINNVNIVNKSPEDTSSSIARDLQEVNYTTKVLVNSNTGEDYHNINDERTNTSVRVDNYEEEGLGGARFDLTNYDDNNRVERSGTTSRIIEEDRTTTIKQDSGISVGLEREVLVGVDVEETQFGTTSNEVGAKLETIASNILANDEINPIMSREEVFGGSNLNSNATSGSAAHFTSFSQSIDSNNSTNNTNWIESNQNTRTIKTTTETSATSSQFLNNNISKSDKLHTEIDSIGRNFGRVNTSTTSSTSGAIFGGATGATKTSSTTATSTAFHPTWDEWKRTHLINNNSTNSNTTNKLNELSSILATKQQQDKLSNETKDYYSSSDNRNILLDNNELNENKIKTTRSIIEETYIQKSSHQNQQYKEKEQENEFRNSSRIEREEEEFEEDRETRNLNQSDQINNSYYHNINNNYYYKQQENLPLAFAQSSTTSNTKTLTNQEAKNYNQNMKSHQHQSNQFAEYTNDVYNHPQPTPIVINQNAPFERRDSSATSSSLRTNKSRTTKHYPVYPIDIFERREPSPVKLSSIVLAKEPPIEVKTQDERRVPPFVDSEPEQQPATPAFVAETPPPKKIKTIMTTQKRKDSGPNLTTESDSDTEIQNRLLAKASGSIPIEYISIRRDPKPPEKKTDKKKSITTGTNTSNDRGKKIAATNTNQDELPQYNLHVSLDSMFVKSRREASTSTERTNKNAATETEIRQKNAATETESEAEPPPPPPPKPEEYVYTTRKSRYTEWETASPPPPPPPEVTTSYRLEFLTKSPRVVHKRNVQTVQYHNQQFVDYPPPPPPQIFEQVRVDEDDRLIFGYRETQPPLISQQNIQHQYHDERHFNRRSGSFPTLFMRPMMLQTASSASRTSNLVNECSTSSAASSGTTRRYFRQTSSTGFAPPLTTTFMPLTSMTMSSSGTASTDMFNQQFSTMHAKFNDIFGLQQQQVNLISEPRTERFYKYSRTTTENKQALPQVVPTFGEIYHRYSARSNSASGLQQSRQQQQHFSSSNSAYNQSHRSPIVEMPLTPDSTMGKSSRERFFSSSETYSSNQNANQGGNYSSSSFSQRVGGGPIITPIHVNSGSGGAMSSSIFQQRTSSFEPVIKQQNYSTTTKTASSSTATNSFGHANNLAMDSENSSFKKFSQKSQGFKAHGREEEESEIVNIRSEADSDKQFKPINNQSVFNDSTRSTPIAVNHSKGSTNSIKRSNFSPPSYEHDGANKQNQNYYMNSAVVN